MTAITRDGIAKLYVATFNRAAEAKGLDYWSGVGSSVTDLTNMEDIASSFADGIEFESAYGELDREAAISKMYENVLGREPDTSGLNYWVNSEIPLNEMVIALINGVANPIDQAYLDNRTEVALAFADSGLNVPGQAQSALYGVNGDDATVTAALASINEAAGIVAPVVGQTIELTSGTDKGADFVGTSEDDSFVAEIAQNSFAGGVSNSLSSADKLDGGEGTDSLYAELVQEFVGATTAVDNNDLVPNTTNIENVTFNNIDDDKTVTVDANEMVGVVKIGSVDSDGDLVIENLNTLDNANSRDKCNLFT